MDLANYKMEWPRERLTVRCFAHDIMNYRYHWHPDEYELNILLHGSQEYCRGTQNVVLEEDDVLLTPPGSRTRLLWSTGKYYCHRPAFFSYSDSSIA